MSESAKEPIKIYLDDQDELNQQIEVAVTQAVEDALVARVEDLL